MEVGTSPGPAADTGVVARIVGGLGRGVAWLDTGTHESLMEAANFIEVIQRRQGLKVSCPEEIAYKLGYIDANQVRNTANSLKQNEYGQYLLSMLEDTVY